jgi:CubicO group peptidase (beta-lactamase class C family)
MRDRDQWRRGGTLRSSPPSRRGGSGPLRRSTLVALLTLGVACASPLASSRRSAAAPLAWGDADRTARLAAAATELEPALAEAVTGLKAPGVAVGLVADGKLVWFKAWGVRDVASGAPVDRDTVFRIASMSKAFVSAAALGLRDEGKLSLDDPAERYLPELRKIAYPTADSPRLTVRQLLSHAGGLPEDNATADLRMPMSEVDFDRLLAAGLSLSTTPGTEFEYSNLGFALAGRIIGRAGGMRVQDDVTRRLLVPLGMSATTWEAARVPEGHRARGYGRKGSAMPSAGLEKYADDAFHEEPVLADGAWAAIGGLWTSPRDYARWVAFQLSAWPPRDEPDTGPVRRASIRETHEVQRAIPFTAARGDRGELEVRAGGYGFGWGSATTCEFPRVVRHGGGLPGYGSFVLLLPEQDVGVFVMSNLTYTGGQPVVASLVSGLHERGLLPERPRPLSAQLVRARAAVLDLLTAWSAERAATAFDANYAAYGPLDRLQARLSGLARLHGACEPADGGEPENALRGRLRLACERGGIELSVELTSDLPPRIQALELASVLPPSEALARAAGDGARLLARWDDGAAARLLEPGADAAAIRKGLSRHSANHGACSLGPPQRGDGSSRGTFRLVCQRGEAALQVELNPVSGRATGLEARTVPGSLRCPR